MKAKTIGLVALALGAAPLSAQPTEFAIPAIATWQHALTSVRLPPSLAGFERASIADFGTRELDIDATYQDRESGTTATFYLFRPGLADVSLWQDRIHAAMQANAVIGPIDPARAISESFTPAQGGGAQSGYRAVAPVVGGDFRSTGFGIFAHDGWLVAVRMSSRSLGVEELRARIDGFLAAIPMPEADWTYPAAHAIPSCAEPLVFKKKAKQRQPDLGSLLVIGSLAASGRGPTDKEGNPAKTVDAVDYCRDGETGAEFAAYRVRGSTNSYILALGDAGISVTVGPSDIGSLLGNADKGAYWAIYTDTEQTRIYAPFTRLPSPAQVLDTIQRQAPVSSVADDPQGGSTITLPAP